MPPDAFAALVDRLWAQVEPLYRAYHCFLRARLSEQYGAAAQRTGPIADFSGVDWDDLAPIVVPKTEAPFDLTQLLVQKNVSVLDMARPSERFYVSLGQPARPQTCWERSMFPTPRDREVGCWPATWTLDNKDDVRLQACLTAKARDFYLVHHELGHAVYYRAYQQQPHLFKGGANDGFHEAVGDFIALSAQTPTYLRQIGLLDRLPGAETDIPFLLAMVDRHAMVFANNLAMEKWRWGVFSGAIAPEQYNDAWWRTLRQYRGVAPPGPRPPDGFDPGIVWHVASYTPVIRYSLAEIYQFQFHRAACRMAGWIGPLHRCSIYGNREVGARFEAMLKLGLSKPWPEALAAFTGEREPTPRDGRVFRAAQGPARREEQGRSVHQ